MSAELEFFMNGAVLWMLAWAISSKNKEIARQEMMLGWMRTRIVNQQALLILSRSHIRLFARAVSMVEMSASDKMVVTITIDTFARDSLYHVTQELDRYTPETISDALVKT